MDSHRDNEGQRQMPENFAHQPSQPMRMQLTTEERIVLKQCGRDSFWYRCVPLTIGFIATIRVLALRGVVSSHPKYGTFFKNLGAAGFGYVIGKASYAPVCQQKILQLENSPLAESMRKGRSSRQIMQEVAMPGSTEQSGTDQEPANLTDDYRRTDIDTDRTGETKGLDDLGRPNLDRDVASLPEQQQPGRSSTSYDELRRKNRAQYQERPGPAAGGQAPPLSASPPRPERGSPLGQPRPDVPHQPSSTTNRVRRNEYGDVIEEVE